MKNKIIHTLYSAVNLVIMFAMTVAAAGLFSEGHQILGVFVMFLVCMYSSLSVSLPPILKEYSQRKKQKDGGR